jgi:hypothetical protein
MSYKRHDHDANDNSNSNSIGGDNFSVPFKDAKPGSSESPLDELDNFIVPGRDEHGAHQTVTFNAPPLLVHQVDVIVRSQLFPYINREAFIRHATVRQIRWLQSIRPESLSQHIAPAIEAILERCFQSQMRKKVQAAFEALRETIIGCQNDGEYTEVLRLCYYVKQRLAEVDPGSVWQQRAWKKFNAEFNDYMEQVAIVMGKKVREEINGVKVIPAGTKRLVMNEPSDDGGEVVN